MNDADGWMGRYGQAMEAGDEAGALACLDSALQIDPESVPALGCKGTLLGEQGRHLEALACFERISEIEPTLGMAHYSRGLQLTALDRIDEAVGAYTKAIDVDPSDPDPFINRGRLRDDGGDPTAAIADYDEALALNRGDEIAWTNRGNSLNALERFDEALHSFEQALALQSDSAPAMLGRSYALMSLGRIDEANAARPRDTPLDPGEVIELRHPLPGGGLLALRYHPGRHSHPELLEEAGRGVLEHCASLAGQAPGLEDGVRIGYGWSLLTVRTCGELTVLCEPDFTRQPMTELRHDATFTLQSLVMQQLMHSIVGLAPCDCSCGDAVAIVQGSLERMRLHLWRVAESEDGFSGWVVGPDSLDEVRAALSSRSYDMVPSAIVARLRPHLIKVLTLPPGCVVEMDGHVVTSVVDADGRECFEDG